MGSSCRLGPLPGRVQMLLPEAEPCDTSPAQMAGPTPVGVPTHCQAWGARRGPVESPLPSREALPTWPLGFGEGPDFTLRCHTRVHVSRLVAQAAAS